MPPLAAGPLAAFKSLAAVKHFLYEYPHWRLTTTLELWQAEAVESKQRGLWRLEGDKYVPDFPTVFCDAIVLRTQVELPTEE